MNYYGRFQLEYNPFIKSSKSILVETEEYKEVTTRLNYLANNNGFGLLTGESGKGKTTILRNWAAGLSKSQYKVIYLSLSTVTCKEFYQQMTRALGNEPRFRKTDNFKMIQEEITRCVLEKRITPVFIIDEANYLNSFILNDLKIIFNFDMDSKDRAVVILAGLPILNNTLRQNAHEPLRQRITMNYNLDGLNKEEAKTYIKEKILRAKGTTEMFTPNAVEAITNAANGTPRVIDKICNTCMIIADSKNQEFINEETVLMAVNETELG